MCEVFLCPKVREETRIKNQEPGTKRQDIRHQISDIRYRIKDKAIKYLETEPTEQQMNRE